MNMQSKVETVSCKKCFYFREHSNQFVDRYTTGECSNTPERWTVKENGRCKNGVIVKREPETLSKYADILLGRKNE